MYWDDLHADCSHLSLAARGAWVWIISNLRNCGGERSTNIEGWARVIGANLEETAGVLQELITERICDSNVTCNGLSQKFNGQITITCRRLVKERKQRSFNNLRQIAFRERHGGNGKVTQKVTLLDTDTDTDTETEEEKHTARSDSKSESSEPQKVVEKPLHRKAVKKIQRTGVDQEQSAIMTLPLADKSEHNLTAADLAELSKLYPGVDPERELLKAKGWLYANPTRRKTHRGIARFIHGWLSRAQDSGNGRGAKTAPQYEPEPEQDEFEDPDEPMRGHPDLIEQERSRRRAKYNNDPVLIEKARTEWRENHGYK